jgi:hypothetical protein
LIDRLVGDLHLGLAGEHDRKVVTDLLGLRFTPKDSHAAAADIPHGPDPRTSSRDP